MFDFDVQVLTSLRPKELATTVVRADEGAIYLLSGPPKMLLPLILTLRVRIRYHGTATDRLVIRCCRYPWSGLFNTVLINSLGSLLLLLLLGAKLPFTSFL